MRRARMIAVELGNASSPADNAFIYNFIRCTTAGTGTTVTPVQLDNQGDTLASTIVATNLISADPSLSGIAILNWPVNQRGSVRWVAAPGDELVIPSTASNGFMFGLSAASSTTQGCSANYLEM
jgi:hypothetical protein